MQTCGAGWMRLFFLGGLLLIVNPCVLSSLIRWWHGLVWMRIENDCVGVGVSSCVWTDVEVDLIFFGHLFKCLKSWELVAAYGLMKSRFSSWYGSWDGPNGGPWATFPDHLDPCALFPIISLLIGFKQSSNSWWDSSRVGFSCSW